MNALMRKLSTSLFFALMLHSWLSTRTSALTYSGHLRLWTLYETDSFTPTTVAEVYDVSTGQRRLMGIVVGRDIAIECDLVQFPTRECVIRKLGQNDELSVDHWSFTDATDKSTVIKSKVTSMKDSWVTGLGIRGEVKEKNWVGKINGSLSTSLLSYRALLGHEKVRARFTELYGQYTGQVQNHHYRVSLGRKPILSATLVDGVTAEYLFGESSMRDSKLVGLFAGIAPDPITKYPTYDLLTFGPMVRYTPNFSLNSETKLLLESALVSELYKGALNRFFLSSKVHFTPVRPWSIFGYSTLELPWKGQDGSLKSSYASLQVWYRPNQEWFVSTGFSQFRIGRFLQPQSIQWMADDLSAQSIRLSNNLDRSHRYRFDIRASYRPFYEFQPFTKLRYERRSIDKNKSSLNSTTISSPTGGPHSPDPASPAQENLDLLNHKNSYRLTGGFRLFLFDDHLETESSFSYHSRYQSTGYDLFQSALWDSGHHWTADLSLQYVRSFRETLASVPGDDSGADNAHHFYANLGASYRFFSDFKTQIRYDFSSERDNVLARRIYVHSMMAQLEYGF